MLGWGSWLDREVAFSSGGGGGGSNSSGFSSRVTLPLARRGQRESPTTVHLSVSANGAYNSGNGSNSVPAVYPSVRKRPGTEPLVLRRLMIDEERNDDEDDAVDGVAMSDNDGQQPLDLTLPKLKVRQHWSGGCIVQVNDRAETATQQRCSPSDATRLDYCCAVDCAPADSDHQLIIRLEASSVVRGHHHGKSPRSAGSAAAANAAKPSDPRRPDAVASDDSEPRPRHQGPSHSHPAAQPSPQSSAVQCGLNAVVPDKFVQFLWACEHRSTPLATPVFNDPVESFPRADAAAPALAMGDDLRRLTRSLQHLHLSGYYYGNLSWKDSTQLLQGTSVGTFLVRDSSDPRYLYALSIQTERGPTSVRIHYSDGSFRLDAEAVLSQRLPRFCSINDLVDHYVLQWKHCRQKGQVWLDDTGQVHSNVVLDKALPRQTPSLQHLCRLSWNRLPSETKLHWSLSGSIPQRVQSFLRESDHQIHIPTAMQIRPIPDPGPHDVLVRMQRVGICGSDVHYWHRGSAGRFVVKAPLVLGHESSGIVVAVGSDVTQLAVGDRVALEPGVPCRTCHHCKTGRYNLCADVQFCATPPVDGTLCKYFAHPADFCFKLPDDVSYELGAMLEPLAVAVYSIQRCEIGMGDAVLVLGAGPIGLLSMLVAKAAGATQVAITDINAERLAFARSLGADSTHMMAVGSTDADGADAQLRRVAADISQALGRQPRAAVECSGAESSIQLGVHALAGRGIMATVGRGPYNVGLPLTQILSKELEIRGIFRYANCYPAALQLVTSGKLQLEHLVTHHFNLDTVEEAFRTALSGQAIKVMIDIESGVD